MSRYAVYAASLLLTLASLLLALRMPGWWAGVVLFGGLAALGTIDLLQRKSTLRRLYPLLAHFRYGLESIGPEMRQYFLESDTEATPLSTTNGSTIRWRPRRSRPRISAS